MNRRDFIRSAGVAAAAVPLSMAMESKAASLSAARPFVFARIRYSSGNWDADPKMPSNLLNSIVEYTSINVEPSERVITLDSEALFSHPFAYLTGNKLVRFTASERENLERYEVALSELRQEEREAIIGRIEMGYSYQELAEALGKPSADAARKATQRALIRLAEELRRTRE